MLGERIIKLIVKNKVHPILSPYIKNQKDLDEAINGIADTIVLLIEIIGWKQTIQWLNFARKINLLKAKNESSS